MPKPNMEARELRRAMRDYARRRAIAKIEMLLLDHPTIGHTGVPTEKQAIARDAYLAEMHAIADSLRRRYRLRTPEQIRADRARTELARAGDR